MVFLLLAFISIFFIDKNTRILRLSSILQAWKNVILNIQRIELLNLMFFKVFV